MAEERSLRFSCARDVPPAHQSARERSLLAAARDGEMHVHVSTIAGDEVLTLGSFHRTPPKSPVPLLRRITGGRTAPAGRGFLLLTLALPHRSALVSVDHWALAPEQFLNRGVRGLLETLRGLGVDVVYPGLDLVTHERRALAALGFIEIGRPTIFQAVLATSGSLAEGPRLLDRADPEGVVPMSFLAEDQATSLGPLLPASKQRALEPEAFAARLAGSYASLFGGAIRRTDAPPPSDAAERDLPLPPAPPAQPSAQTVGRLGPVEAWLLRSGDRITGLTLAGDFLAPAETPRRLSEALAGHECDPNTIERVLRETLEDPDVYVLGLRPAELIELVCRSATMAS